MSDYLFKGIDVSKYQGSIDFKKVKEDGYNFVIIKITLPLKSFNLTGLDAQKKLEEIGITTNKNMLPGDQLSPGKTSGLRIGCAAITTRGATRIDVIDIATVIGLYLDNKISKEEAQKTINRIVSSWKDISKLGD